jgi:arylsulfatase A-like enzyme
MKFHPFAFDDMEVRDENLVQWPRTPEVIQASLADYYALISHLDKKVGEIVETLKKNNLFENTIIVYSADNGLAIGSHGLMGKQNLYEHSIKVPLIISGPGIPADRTNDAFIYLFDLFPTLCSLSGLPNIEGLDGKDITPVIKSEIRGVRNQMFTVYRNTVRAVRDIEWKLIRYPYRDYNQLFNLKDDPLELNNLATKEIFNSKVREMTELLLKCQAETGDTALLNTEKILPMEYDPLLFSRKPDPDQPEYVLKKYFSEYKATEKRDKTVQFK